MLIRTEDFISIEKLAKGSAKKVWYTCEECGLGVLTQYRIYLRSNKLCRSCNGKLKWQDKEYKKKQKNSTRSESTKKTWKTGAYDEAAKLRWKNEKTVKKASEIATKNWTDPEIRNKRKIASVNFWESKKGKRLRGELSTERLTPDERLKEICDNLNYEYIGRKLVPHSINSEDNRQDTVIIFKCDKGHYQEKRLPSFKFRCNKCSNKSSNAEQEVANYIKELGFDILENNRSMIHPYELDIVIPSKKIAIEYCGIYWHSQLAGKDKNYHLNKLELCEKLGYRLITIFEDEWILKRKVVKSFIKHMLSKNDNKLFARKCIIEQIDNKITKEFIDKYHIQGYPNPGSVELGAFYNNKLVAVMTFRKLQEDVWDLNRFCLGDYNVIGIAGKLLKYFQRNYKWNKIISFANRRWSQGKVYETLGFEKDSKKIIPSYWYFNLNEYSIQRFHKFGFRRRYLENKLENFNPDLSEWENMKANGWNRIWDCGNIKYVVQNEEN